jgi:protein involved in polysaccharide export with SLBB domain
MRWMYPSLFTLLLALATRAQESATQCYRLDSLLAPGNAVRITVYPDSTHFLNGVYPIDDRGCIRLPIAGLVHIVSSSEEQLLEYLKEVFVDYLRYPTLIVTPLIRLSLLGGFYSPGLYWIDPRASLWEAVARGGGVEREDGIKKLRWERDRELVVQDLVPIYQSGKSLLSIGFRSGDQLWVTSRPRVTGWERFRTEYLPLLTTLATVATSAVTLYQTTRLLREE